MKTMSLISRYSRYQGRIIRGRMVLCVRQVFLIDSGCAGLFRRDFSSPTRWNRGVGPTDTIIVL